MSSVETLTEARWRVSGDHFVEINYDDVIPNNVALCLRQAAAARAGDLAAEISRLVERHGSRGLSAVGGLSAHRRRRRPERLGQVRLRARCRNTAGACCSRRKSRAAPFPSAATRASPPGRRFRANIARSCAGSSSCRATPSRPRSSSSAISARPRRASTTCATSSRSMSRKAATSGRSSICW